MCKHYKEHVLGILRDIVTTIIDRHDYKDKTLPYKDKTLLHKDQT